MSHQDVDRRKFNRLAAAAFGGLVAGASVGCGSKTTPAPSASEAPAPSTGSGMVDDAETAMTDTEVHLCRGLNACKGKGADGKNDCAGKGSCGTAEHHGCHAKNACKGQGGCGETAGANDCKGKGECAVPLMDDTWKKVRAQFEEKYKAEGKELGAAPAKA